jgi:hypothetical protein
MTFSTLKPSSLKAIAPGADVPNRYSTAEVR